ncbi:MurR/RpiR family transcriptional regulator [Dethiosulfatarculus sandiegensis]|nr:MurR/RpiR family transcriptional regulator [Dethiosulfatarculus sandiegensis]
MSDKSLFERIRSLDKMTPSEVKISNYFERQYSMLAFETITTISRGSSVGNATVGRFIHRLGYDDFADFSMQVRQEIVSRLESPIERYNVRMEALTSGKEDILGRHIQYAIRNMQETRSRISNKDIKQAARYLALAKGNVYVAGGASAQAIARYFCLLSKYIRKNVVLLNGDISTLAHQMVDVNRNDALLAISHKRYSRTTMKTVEWFKKCRGKIVTVTDQETSPIAKLSDVRFIVRSEGPAMFNSRLVTFLLIETLIEAMVFLVEDQVSKRFPVFESLFEELDVFIPNS